MKEKAINFEDTCTKPLSQVLSLLPMILWRHTKDSRHVEIVGQNVGVQKTKIKISQIFAKFKNLQNIIKIDLPKFDFKEKNIAFLGRP